MRSVVFVLSVFLSLAFSQYNPLPAQQNNAQPTPVDGSEVDRWFQAQRRSGIRTVLSIAGFSGGGYENIPAVEAAVRRDLTRFDPRTTIVNGGATNAGIGAIGYRAAQAAGFRIVGIVSSEAIKGGATPDVFSGLERTFYVQDSTWGGTNSPTSAAWIRNSDVYIAYGGGAVARDELNMMRAAGKMAIQRDFDQNHQKLDDKRRSKNITAPASAADYRGDGAQFARSEYNVRNLVSARSAERAARTGDDRDARVQALWNLRRAARTADDNGQFQRAYDNFQQSSQYRPRQQQQQPY